MTTTDLDALTDKLAKTDDTMFPVADKLSYYNIALGILNAYLSAEQEDNNEVEEKKTTGASQSDYKEPARILSINWLKINYGEGFIPATYMSEDKLKARYGNEWEAVVASWPKSSPIYRYKGHHLFVNPAPTADEAGADRLWLSVELLPADIEEGGTVDLPVAWQHLPAAYAAMQFLDEDDPLWKKAKRMWDEGLVGLLDTSFPRAKENEAVARIPDDDGSNY